MKRTLAAFTALIVLTIACGSSSTTSTSSNSASGADPGVRRVRYEITGTDVSAVSLTYENDSGGTEQGDYEVPFRKNYTFSRGDFLYISAQIIQPTNNAGSIECRIYVDGEEVYYAKASGFPSIATCSGSAP